MAFVHQRHHPMDVVYPTALYNVELTLSLFSVTLSVQGTQSLILFANVHMQTTWGNGFVGWGHQLFLPVGNSKYNDTQVKHLSCPPCVTLYKLRLFRGTNAWTDTYLEAQRTADPRSHFLVPRRPEQF